MTYIEVKQPNAIRDGMTGMKSEFERMEKRFKNEKFRAFEGLVYPSSPLCFNDPYDCEFCFQSDALEGVLDRETYIHLLERSFSLKQEEKNRILYSDNIERAMQIVLQAHGGRLSDSWMNILQNGLNDCMSTIKDAVRVVCLSEVYDSMLMWSHYAQNHTGFCIEYDFKESDMLCKQLYPVIYTKDRYAVSKADMISEYRMDL